MSLRSAFGILGFAALCVSASASVVGYRVTGTFDETYGDYDPLLGTTFSFTFSYDTDAPDLGDEYTGMYQLLTTHLDTAMGAIDGIGGIGVDKDEDYGSVSVSSAILDQYSNQLQGYGLIIPDLAPQAGRLPTDLVSLAATSSGTPTFILQGDSNPHFDGSGLAFANKVNIEAVPEPATMLALAGGAAALIRRRR